MKILNLAVKNFIKYFPNYLFLGVAVIIFYIILNLILAFGSGMEKKIKTNITAFYSGDFSIKFIDKVGNNFYSQDIADYEKISSIIAGGIIDISPDNMLLRYNRDLMIINEGKNMSCSFIGINYDSEERLQDSVKLKGGSWDELKKNPGSLIIGDNVRKTFNVNIGDYVTILGKSSYGYSTSDIFVVSGIIESCGPIFDNVVFIDLNTLRDFLEVEEETGNQILFYFKNSTDKEIENRMRAVYNILGRNDIPLIKKIYNRSGYYIQSWMSFSTVLKGLYFLFNFFFGFFFLLSLLIITIGSINSFSFMFLKRIKDIGIMLVIGIPFRKILQILISEGIIFSFFFSSVGLGILLILGYFFRFSEIPITNQAFGYILGSSSLVFNIKPLNLLICYLIIFVNIIICYSIVTFSFLKKNGYAMLRSNF